ncbi:MAG: ribbon-helix-helix protein, CopG family [Candidatus Lokiarchaeota archaeon]|nr:ribbon-helix-helix protein, CopG family [Candidatus Lokiarchaeota archaeon]
MKVLTISLPESDLKILEEFVKNNFYSNVSEYIRSALKDYLWEELEKIE